MPAHQGKFVAYFRVSTDRQGKSGLGLDAQRKSVHDYLDGGRWELVGEFTEVESGKRSDRPELEKALAACKRYSTTSVVEIISITTHSATDTNGITLRG
jgi:DNA invertase Pin-like site-specific DNA recombinase